MQHGKFVLPGTGSKSQACEVPLADAPFTLTDKLIEDIKGIRLFRVHTAEKDGSEQNV